jgi:hypothetical protein
MTSSRADLADLHGFGSARPELAVVGPHISTESRQAYARPQRGWTPPERAEARAVAARRITTGGVLITVASLLLAGLAVAMGIVSWHAQFSFIFGIKHERLAAALEALGLDAGAVIFSILGIALARLGRRAVIERVLVCICAAGSCAMNAAGADLGSPRSVAAFVMPPVLFAITSDRLVSVIRRSALGPKADAESQRSAWRVAGTAFLYLLRLAVAPPSTVRGARRALLNATPLPAAAPKQAITSAPRPVRKPRRARVTKTRVTKTQRLIDLVTERHGPLVDFPLTDVSKVATATAAEIGMHGGSARTALKAAVVAAQAGGAE